MEVVDLARALMAGDLLVARQWVADALRDQIEWAELECPTGLDERGLAVAAGTLPLRSTTLGLTRQPHFHNRSDRTSPETTAAASAANRTLLPILAGWKAVRTPPGKTRVAVEDAPIVLDGLNRVLDGLNRVLDGPNRVLDGFDRVLDGLNRVLDGERRPPRLYLLGKSRVVAASIRSASDRSGDGVE